MASQPQLAKQNFRETGKFKSINEQPPLQTECFSPTLCNMQSERFGQHKSNPKKFPLLPSQPQPQPRQLKISQRLTSNRKESSLVPSEMEYSASVKDEKQKDSPYYDEFQNLLYEQQGNQQQQLALNDSFQEFQKREHSEKNLQIIMQLNKRKQKETKEKRELDQLKQRIKELIAQEKQWISENLKLKSEIKQLKTPKTPEQTKKIDQTKARIGELKFFQRLGLFKSMKQLYNKPVDPKAPI